MLLLLFAGAKSSGPPPPPAPTTSVLVSANCAYATEDLVSVYGTEDTTEIYAPAECFVHIGWPDTLRRKASKKAFQRLLKLQRDNTFSRRWFEEFEAAQQEFANADVQAALDIGVQQAKDAAEEIDSVEIYQDRFREIAAALQAAARAKSVEEKLEIARYAAVRARNLKEWLEEEDDELAILLGE